MSAPQPLAASSSMTWLVNGISWSPTTYAQLTALPSTPMDGCLSASNWAAAHDSDNELQTLLGSATFLRLKKLPLPGTTVSIYCDTPTRRSLSYVPGPLRLQVFQSVLDLSPPGLKATAKMVAEHFVWPGVQKDCRNWTCAWQSYQRSKVSWHTVTPFGDFMLPATHLLHIHYETNRSATDKFKSAVNANPTAMHRQHHHHPPHAHTHYTLWAPCSFPCSIHHLSSHLRRGWCGNRPH
jgi:hypothetical protein